MSSSSDDFFQFINEIKVVERAVLAHTLNCGGRTLICKCFKLDYNRWKVICKEHDLEGWIALPMDEFLEGLLEDIVLWEIERVRKSSLPLCIGVLKVDGIRDNTFGSPLALWIKKKLHLTDYVFPLKENNFLILFTDSSIFSSKKTLLAIISDIKEKSSGSAVCAGMVCYRGKKKIGPKELINMAKRLMEVAFKSEESLVVDFVAEEENIQVTAEEKRFLFSI